MTISVTQEDIDQGTACNPFCCPIALVLRRIRPRGRVSVGPLGVSMQAQYQPLPPAVCDFIAKFDLGQTVSPFQFDLNIV